MKQTPSSCWSASNIEFAKLFFLAMACGACITMGVVRTLDVLNMPVPVDRVVTYVATTFRPPDQLCLTVFVDDMYGLNLTCYSGYTNSMYTEVNTTLAVSFIGKTIPTITLPNGLIYYVNSSESTKLKFIIIAVCYYVGGISLFVWFLFECKTVVPTDIHETGLSVLTRIDEDRIDGKCWNYYEKMDIDDLLYTAMHKRAPGVNLVRCQHNTALLWYTEDMRMNVTSVQDEATRTFLCQLVPVTD